MLCITSKSNDPYFNLAAEEYLFKEFHEDVFMLWRSEPAVIVGKHQNTLAEINIKFIKKNNIKVARRLSGGGTVYHDPGNINFTFIVSGKKGKLVNFNRFIEPVLKVLHNLSVDAEFEGKNSIVVNGRKVSGNAEHVFRNRVLHHGTLLFDSKLDVLDESLKVIPNRYNDKAVRSVRSTVTNIKQHLITELGIPEFRDLLLNYIIENYDNSKIYHFNTEDTGKIRTLANDKYATWEWIYGYSPEYSLDCICDTSRGKLMFRIFVEKGIIIGLENNSENNNLKEFLILSGSIKGLPHRERELKQKIEEIADLLSFTKTDQDSLVDSMF